jgi:lipopolysaccharide transport system permease protein
VNPSRRQVLDLVLHLVRRQLESQHRFTLLGWLWPLMRQLAQLAVLVFLFSNVIDLGIEDFPLFVFTGLLVWSWFAAAVTSATTVLIAQRHLVLSPRFPAIALPLVAVAVPLVDTLIALPVVGVMLIAEGEVHATLALLPALLALEFVLIAGVALAVAVANVYVRDVESVVAVGLMLLFYLTPVFYGARIVPERFQIVLDVNPVAQIVEIARRLMLDGRFPDVGALAYVCGASAALLALGWWLFRRLETEMVDEL